MSRPDEVQWMKPSGHGPSATHLVKEKDDEAVVTYCGREVENGREFLDEDEADGECSRCVAAWRKALLRKDELTLEEMAEAQLVTDKSAEIIMDHGLDPKKIEGTGKHGRILTEDARKAAKSAAAGEGES